MVMVPPLENVVGFPSGKFCESSGRVEIASEMNEGMKPVAALLAG